MQTKLSVNINKFATLRNSRGGQLPDLTRAIDIIYKAGAHGVTIHPRADQRHITSADIKTVCEYTRSNYPSLEINIEGDARQDLILNIIKFKPDQATLVPVTPGEITSDHGYQFDKLDINTLTAIERFKDQGIRVILFADADPQNLLKAHERGLIEPGSSKFDGIEIYTGPYAHATNDVDRKNLLEKIQQTCSIAHENKLVLNAGHDLDTDNIPDLIQLNCFHEMSIGHRLICHALFVGFEQAVLDYLHAMR